jgi:hypothetical protein
VSKGSRQRPTADTFRDNWDKIFGDSKKVVESVDGYEVRSTPKEVRSAPKKEKTENGFNNCRL